MKKNHIYIIIILLCSLLTGCTNKEVLNDEKIRNLEQINIMDIKYLTLYEKISGIEISKQRIIAENQETVKDEKKLSGVNNIEKENNEDNQDIKNQDLVESKEIVYNNNLLGQPNVSDWKASRELCYEIQNLVLDVIIEMRKANYDETYILQYENELDNLINCIVMENKNESEISISKLLDYSLSFVEKNIQSRPVYLIKKLYYDSIGALIYEEIDDKLMYENKITKMQEGINELMNLVKDENIIYLESRISNLISNINKEYNNENKKNIRLKLVMILESIPSLNNYIQKVDNYKKL